MNTLLKAQVSQWATSNEIDLSCQAMIAAALNEVGPINHPTTVNEMGQCLQLVQDIPVLREHFSSIAAVSTEWYYLIENWEQISRTYTWDMRQFGTKRNKGQRTWELLQQLQAQSTAIMQF